MPPVYQVYFYKDRNGDRPVRDYMKWLSERTDKGSRLKLKKIGDYINALEERGLMLREPHIKHIEGDLWELRPMRDRIFFVAWHHGSFVLLHHFEKNTVKTPKREIERAKRELGDLKERGICDA